MKIRISTFSPILLAAAFASAALAQGSSCESLASLALPNTTITMSQAVPAGPFTQPGRGGRGGPALNLPAFCRVAATLKPSNDSDIKMEIWLPASGWNGNLEEDGNGAWTGSINAASLAAGLQRGYATAMSDLGHEGGSASFALGHPEKLIDWGYRASHETAVAAKAIVTKFYGRGPKLSYWNGCSAGGRQALMEAQRYPADFDGIVAGSPGLNWTGRATQAVWIAQATHKDDASFIPREKFTVIHDAAIQACDARDGAKDGIIEDPTRCNFDPQQLECKDADGPTCLTKAQVETARAIYATYPNQGNKQDLFPGFEPGSELGWTTMAGPNAFGPGTDLFKYIVFQDANWDYKTFHFATDVARTEKADGGTMNAMNPDLGAFLKRGGKMIQYHGWADPQIAPGSSVNYYKNVLETMGGTGKVQGFYRLFMVPGMAHCGGGEGTSQFDMLTAVEGWVEKGQAPEQIPASRVKDGKVDRTRPLCPYPQVAQYKGSGSIDDAANFACKAQ
ncbi:MAG: tannase/feruloyl esterase family alpha/beta hydrolase [Acidobacteriia bacterium]|nr:tannase/feruloyl esterase family alpha/beta hydrolase [Terriglobia bacterium]